MEIKIGKTEITAPAYKNCYKVYIEYMIGDAGEEEETIYISEKNKAFEEFMKCLEMCCKAFDVSGQGGGDSYADVPGYSKFFGEIDEDDDDEDMGDDVDDDEEEDEDDMTKYYIQSGKTIGADHPNEPGGWDSECGFVGYEVSYFDSFGKEFPVTIKFSKEEKEEMRTALEEAGYEVAKKWK